MAGILPLKGLRYAEGKTISLAEVTAPPYDVISLSEQEELYRKSPHNIIRLILGKELSEDTKKNNKYTRAGAFLKEWEARGVLRKDEQSSFYIYQQQFRHQGVEKIRRGILALLRLEEFSEGAILPHERTLAEPKEDRLELIRATQANLSPIFVIYSDPENFSRELFREEEKLSELKSTSGEKHQLGVIFSPEKIKKIQGFFQNKKIYIADGHHRYETALNYQKEMHSRAVSLASGAPCDYILTYFTSMEDKGLTILPAHRLLSGEGSLDIAEFKKSLSVYFEITSLAQPDELISRMAEGDLGGEHLLGMYTEGELSLLKLKEGVDLTELIPGKHSLSWKQLDVNILHELVIQKVLSEGEFLRNISISYVTQVPEALSLIKEGKKQLAFFLNPPTVGQIEEVISSGERMPGKATYFYPKLLSGLLMRKM